MTYFYLFETKDYVYCGQHRIANNKDPMKDYYKGSGTKWVRYLKENGWWKINDFRNNVKKTILEVVMDDENRQVIGNVEKYWIEWSKETYNDKCINIAKGSKPNSIYANEEDYEESLRIKNKKYNTEHKLERQLYHQTHKAERAKYIEKNRDYINMQQRVNKFIRIHGKSNNFPKTWSEEDIAYYKTRIY